MRLSFNSQTKVIYCVNILCKLLSLQMIDAIQCTFDSFCIVEVSINGLVNSWSQYHNSHFVKQDYV